MSDVEQLKCNAVFGISFVTHVIVVVVVVVVVVVIVVVAMSVDYSSFPKPLRYRCIPF